MNCYCLFMFLSILTFATAATVSPSLIDATEEIDEDEGDDSPKECTKRNNEPGFCVDYYQCLPDDWSDIILYGGIINHSELRDASQCHSMQWCCSLPQNNSLTTPTEVKKVDNAPVSRKCKHLDSDICTWCVTLHKVVDKTVTESESYCVGALIGTNTVLTAGTCLLAANSYIVFVRAPESPNPKQNHYSKNQYLHPSYNSGSHWYDFGIIELEDTVNWSEGVPRGACLGSSDMTGTCFTFGLDAADELVSTEILINRKSCSNMGGGGSVEGACGATTDNNCFAIYGAPVVCGEEKLALVGVARSDCKDGNVAIGVITESLNWTTSVFKTLNIAEDVYITDN